MLAPGVRSAWSPRATYASKSFWRNLCAARAGAAMASARAAATVVLTAILISERDSEHDVPTGVERELLVAAQETAVANIGRVADREIDVAGPAEQRPHEAGREIEERVAPGRDVERIESGLPGSDFDLGPRVGAVRPAQADAMQLGAQGSPSRRNERQRLPRRLVRPAHRVHAGAQCERDRDRDLDCGLAAEQAGICLLVAIHPERVWGG